MKHGGTPYPLEYERNNSLSAMIAFTTATLSFREDKPHFVFAICPIILSLLL